MFVLGENIVSESMYFVEYILGGAQNVFVFLAF